MSAAVFYIIAFGIASSAVLSVTVPNVFHSAVWLSVTLMSVACLYFYLSAGFLGVVQILIYVGGIMTLFVFAIMLTARIDDASIRQVCRQFWPGLLTAALLLAVTVKIVASVPWAQSPVAAGATDLHVIGRSLLTTYAVPFEFMSLLLLAALVGAIVIGKVKK